MKQADDGDENEPILPTAESFGLIGGFPGDETKFQAAADVVARLPKPRASTVTTTTTTENIVEVLDQLPMKGRFYFVLQGIGKSPNCREIVKKLSDWCFEFDEQETASGGGGRSSDEDEDADLDQDFVLVLPSSGGGGTRRDLNPLRNHIMRVLCLTAGDLGEAGVELCRDYLASSSTMFRAQVLQSMAKNPSVTDEELEQVFHDSVVNHQGSIISTCEEVSHRHNFLFRLYQQGLVPVHVLFGDPNTSVIQPILEEKPTVAFRKWKFHAPLYLNMLEVSFQKLEHDPLGRGAALRTWEKRCGGGTDFGPEHAMQVLRLCDTYRPMELISSPAVDRYVASILVKASAAGELGKTPTDLEQVVQAFPVCCKMINKREYISWILNQVQPCSDRLGVGFVDPTREAFLSRAIASAAIYTNSQLVHFVVAYLDQVEDELFWRALRGDESSAPSCSVRFFQLIASICKALSQGRQVNLARDATKAWCRVHRRCKPPKVVPTDEIQERLCSDWNLWRNSYMGVVLDLTRNAARRHQAAIRRSAPTGLSAATLWVGFSRIILEMEIDGYITMYEAGFVDKQVHASSLLEALEFVENISSNHCNYKTCQALAEKVMAIVEANVLPILGTFDTAQEAERNYVLRKLVPLVVRLCQGHFKDRPGFLVSVAHRIRGFSQRALPPETLVKNPCLDKRNFDADGRTVRTFYRANVEQQQACADALVSNLRIVFEQLCMHCSERRTGGASERYIAAAMQVDDMQREIQIMYSWFPEPEWMVNLLDANKDASLPGTAINAKITSISERVNLIRRVAAAWPGIVERETPLLRRLGKLVVSASMYERFYGDFKELGIDDKILGDSDENTRLMYLVVKNSDVAAPGVREYLEEQTTGRDPTERMKGYRTFLSLSLETSLEEFARTAKFVANRTKNEAGIYRSSLLDGLVQSAYAVVEKSFAEAATDGREQEKKVVDSARIVCEAFTKLFRDDVAKRDTVGRTRFLSISRELLRYCLGATAKRLAHTGLELHSVWVTEALRLQWIHAEVAGGEAQLRNFNWQLPNADMRDNWVDNDAFDSSIGPLLKDEILMRRIRASIYFGRHWADAKSLNPDERVSLLQTGLRAVITDHVERVSDSSVSVGDGSLSELQLNSLFHFTKERWIQVPVLVKAVKEATPEKGFDRAYRVFTLACSLFNENLWCHEPLLASACESLLQKAIAQHRGKPARDILYRYWFPMRKRLATFDFSTTDKDPAVSSFFLSIFGGPLKSDVVAVVRKRSQRIPDDLPCSLARILLEKTRSAWYLTEVKEAVEKSRDDVLADLFESGGNSVDPSSGVFYPYAGNAASAQPPFHFVPYAIQVQLRSKALCLYTDYCLAGVYSRSFNVQVRSSRVSEFVEAPCTGYRDILGLLEEMEEGPLLESLLLSIFRVDSAWKVLAYLLRPSVIAKRSIRTTGGLLDRVAKEMPARSVELVLSILLKEGPRQKALTPYLMKCIFRALFDIDSETAAGLIRAQWNRGVDLHKDVRHDLVRLAVLTIVPSLCGTASHSVNLMPVAWEILESSCADPDLEVDSAVLILAPQWTSSSSTSSFVQVLASPTGLVHFQLPQTSNSAKEEAFHDLNSKLSKVRETAAFGLRLALKPEAADTSVAVNRYGEALRVLSKENASAPVRVKARCQSHAFTASCLLGLDEDLIGIVLKKQLQSTLETLLARTEASPDCADLDVYDNYELITVASLLAAFTMKAVELGYSNLPAEVRAMDAVKALTGVVEASHCVKILVAFLGDCVEALLSTPPRATSRTLSLAAVIHVVSANVDQFSRTLPQLSNLLFSSLSSEQIRSLKLAGAATNSIALGY